MRLALLIFITLFLVSGLCAFEKGTINVGGSASYTSCKEDKDADAENTLSIAPQIGYFFIDDLAVDLLLNFESTSQGDISGSTLDIGLGGRYFYKNFYGGLGLMHESISWDNGLSDGSGSGNYLGLKGGYLFPIARNVFVDFGIHYNMGFGDYGGDWDGKNEESEFGLNVGFQIFYKVKNY